MRLSIESVSDTGTPLRASDNALEPIADGPGSGSALEVIATLCRENTSRVPAPQRLDVPCDIDAVEFRAFLNPLRMCSLFIACGAHSFQF